MLCYQNSLLMAYSKPFLQETRVPCKIICQLLPNQKKVMHLNAFKIRLHDTSIKSKSLLSKTTMFTHISSTEKAE